MKCPKCNDVINDYGIVRHLRLIHKFDEWDAIEILFELLDQQNDIYPIP